LKPFLLRLYRAGILVSIAWLIHAQQRWMKAQMEGSLDISRVRDFFPGATTLGPREPESATQRVLGTNGEFLGMVTQTAPLSDGIIGYSGPTNTLIALDMQGRVLGLRVLHSDDTAEHLANVLRTRKFFESFKGIKRGEVPPTFKVDAVSGATLTSSAIAEGVLRRLGQQGVSLRFPDEITLAEVQQILPKATMLQPSKSWRGVIEVLDEKKHLLGYACRTSPLSDSIVGYKGPSDTLVVLNGWGSEIVGVRLRKSYDTKDYVAYVTGDKYFLRLFEGMQTAKLGDLDFKAAQIEGVSGATETSWAVAEGLKRRAKQLAAYEKEKPFWQRMRWDADNLGLAAILIWSCLVAFTPLRGKAWVRIPHQLLLVGYAGFHLGSMISQGLLVGWSAHGIPWTSAPALVLLTTAALLLPLLTRHQFYCHHFCPHGALQQLAAHRLKWQIAVPKSLSRLLEKIPLVLLIVVLLTALLGWKVNLNALEPFDAYLFRVAGWSTLIIAVVGLIASLFVPLAYCRYGCPTGALLKFVRYAGHGDTFGKRDLVALGLTLVALGVTYAAKF